jgi:hypothetical protein
VINTHWQLKNYENPLVEGVFCRDTKQRDGLVDSVMKSVTFNYAIRIKKQWQKMHFMRNQVV